MPFQYLISIIALSYIRIISKTNIISQCIHIYMYHMIISLSYILCTPSHQTTNNILILVLNQYYEWFISLLFFYVLDDIWYHICLNMNIYEHLKTDVLDVHHPNFMGIRRWKLPCAPPCWRHFQADYGKPIAGGWRFPTGWSMISFLRKNNQWWFKKKKKIIGMLILDGWMVYWCLLMFIHMPMSWKIQRKWMMYPIFFRKPMEASLFHGKSKRKHGR